jgi:hypothetical protein
MPTKTKPPLPRWRIVLIRKKGETLGTVEARTAEEAVAIAAEQFNVAPEQRKRLAAQPLVER